MEDDSLQHHHLGSAHYPVKGMESVLATVSGYHGSERFNLIRLIARTGASYVGNMNQSVTHLICWKFEGRKYELAKKFRITVVNHCWIEECIKRGRRVSEEPYTLNSGEEMGPLVLDILLAINQEKAQSKRIANEPVVDVECEDVNNTFWRESILIDEDLCPQLGRKSHHSSKSVGKKIKGNSRIDGPSRSKHRPESGSKIIELEETSTSQLAYSCLLKKRNSTSLEPQSKGRRLVKKHNSIKDWLITSNVEEEYKEVKPVPQARSRGVLLEGSDVERRQFTSSRHASRTRRTLIGQDNSDDDDIEEIVHVNEQNSHANAVPSSSATSDELHEAANLDSTEVDPVEELPASSELSCVICWTDFSPTRGVLPCGHRFCFSCIQDWSNHMAERRKPSTCPLCKASFICITKVEDAVSSDQKIYSQSIPNDNSKTDLYILADETYSHQISRSPEVCCRCSSREPEDLLMKCNVCQTQCIHSYCLDPPLLPWTCVRCQDLYMLFLHSR